MKKGQQPLPKTTSALEITCCRAQFDLVRDQYISLNISANLVTIYLLCPNRTLAAWPFFRHTENFLDATIRSDIIQDLIANTRTWVPN